MAEHFMNYGQWPATLDEPGMPPPQDRLSGAVQSIELEPGGAIRVTLRGDVDEGPELRLVPNANASGSIEWTCLTTRYPATEPVPGCTSADVETPSVQLLTQP